MRFSSPENAIYRLEATNKELEKENQKLKAAYKNKSTISGLTLAVNIFIAGIVWWAGATVYWQLVPESLVQESVSSLAKKMSDGKTGYELAREGNSNLLIIKKQKEELQKWAILNEKLNTIIHKEDEIIKDQSHIIMGFENTVLRMEEELAFRKEPGGKRRKWNEVVHKEWENKEIPQKSNTVYDSKIFETVSKIRNEVMGDFSHHNVQVKIQEQSGGHVLVWLEYNGKKSLGFCADNNKNENCLTKKGMSTWIQESINQLSLIERIESIALAENIDSSKESFTSMKTDKRWSWNIGVTLYDTVSKKNVRFTVWKNDTNESIVEKIRENRGYIVLPD